MQPCTVEKLTGVRCSSSQQQLKRARARFSKLARVCAQLDRRLVLQQQPAQQLTGFGVLFKTSFFDTCVYVLAE